MYLTTLLFLGPGLPDTSRNFHRIAMPAATLAMGSISSTEQVVSLIHLTLQAWQFRNTSQTSQRAPAGLSAGMGGNQQTQSSFFEAEVFGCLINLPIMTYFEHGTYLSVSHGYVALMVAIGLVPVGIAQLNEVQNHGSWRVRSQAFVQGDLFHCLTGARIIGGVLFALGGIVPIACFTVSLFVHSRLLRRETWPPVWTPSP